MQCSVCLLYVMVLVCLCTVDNLLLWIILVIDLIHATPGFIQTNTSAFHSAMPMHIRTEHSPCSLELISLAYQPWYNTFFFSQ
jgi:hypothetical protein